jgi:predicted lipase
MNLIFAFCLFFCITQVSSSFNETFARYFIWPMASSAYSDHPEICVKDNYNQSEFKRRIKVNCDTLKNDNCVAFTAVTHSNKAIIISFRGSEDLEGIMEIIDVIKVPPTAEFGGKAKVNHYFYNAFNDLWTSGIKDDFLSLKNKNPNYELWITGHSLGGAMASLAAATIATSNLFPLDKIKLVTFGEPRIGDKTYAELHDSLIPYAYRIIHNHDIFPHEPPSWIYGYQHHKSEVWYNNDMAVGDSYVECDEDESKKCSESVVNLNPLDHQSYYNVKVIFANSGCDGWNPYKNKF